MQTVHAILARYPSRIAGRPRVAHCPLPIHCPLSVGTVARRLSFGVRPLALAIVAACSPSPSPLSPLPSPLSPLPSPLSPLPSPLSPPLSLSPLSPLPSPLSPLPSPLPSPLSLSPTVGMQTACSRLTVAACLLRQHADCWLFACCLRNGTFAVPLPTSPAPPPHHPTPPGPGEKGDIDGRRPCHLRPLPCRLFSLSCRCNGPSPAPSCPILTAHRCVLPLAPARKGM
jgi:hypothetical protein